MAKRLTQKQGQANQGFINAGKSTITGKIEASHPVVTQQAGKNDNIISGSGMSIASHQPDNKTDNTISGSGMSIAGYQPQKIDPTPVVPSNTVYNPTAPAGSSANTTPTLEQTLGKADLDVPEGGNFLNTHQWDHLKPNFNESPSDRTSRYNNILGAFIDNPTLTMNDFLDFLGNDDAHKRNFQNYLLDNYTDDDVRPYSTPNFAYDTGEITPYEPDRSGGQKTDALGLGLGGADGSVGNSSSSYYSRVGGGGRGSVGGSAAYANGYDLNSLYDLLNARLNEYNNQYGSLMDSVLGAFNTNSANLEDYYTAVMNALGLNLSDTENLLRSQLAQNQQTLEDERRRALQEQYLSRMLAEKNLADRLDAYGLRGGASESVMADLLNNYMNGRASVEEKTQASLADLLQNYLTNLSNARQAYNQNVMGAAQNRLNARQQLANNLAESQANAANYLANARSGAYDDLFTTLANLYTRG